MAIEVLSPAGDYDSFKFALLYGADAVYLGGRSFGMRAAPKNFSEDELASAVREAHSLGKKVYLTCNSIPRNGEIPALEGFIKTARDIGVDAMIAADTGVFAIIKKFAPDIEIHASTQTGIMNYAAARALYEMGAGRAVLARELTICEIAEIRAKTPKGLELETFVHGAMCVSFSGRCLLSAYLTGRNANNGECAQPCRWGYGLVEEKRPGQYYPVFEEDGLTYILNAKDLCMIEYLDKLAEAGVKSFKIEGRAKSFYYVAAITNAYRAAVNVLESGAGYILPEWIKEEVLKVSHREYSTGFFLDGNKSGCADIIYENGGYVREYDIAAVIDKCENGRIYATQRNKFSEGDCAEVMSPGVPPEAITIGALYNVKGERIDSAPHAMMKVSIQCEKAFPENSIIRIKK